jgi:hypothetical protein
MDQRKRLEAAYKLLDEQTTTIDKFQSVSALVEGINPKIDKNLQEISKILSKIKQIQKGEVIDVTAENLPEDTQEKKKRKKFLLLLLKNWKALKGEIKRVQKEYDQMNDEVKSSQKADNVGRIVSFAKGPFGVITLIAVLAVGWNVLNRSDKPKSTESIEKSGKKIKVIEVDGKQIALSELVTGQGPECLTNGTQVVHYHARDHIQATALDGTLVKDPGGCGFGKQPEVKILEIEQ